MLRKRCVKIIGGNGAENSSQKENEGRRAHKDLIGALIAGTRKQQEAPPLYPRKRLEVKQPPPVPKFRKPLETQRSRDNPTPTSRTKASNDVRSRNKYTEASSGSRPTSIDFGLRQKDQGQAQAGEDLSRASSISNLNENSKKAGALSKVRKSVSKDRLDNGEKRLDKKGCKNNNHQVELDGAGDEIEGLQKQLEAMTSEKAELVLQLGENRNQLTALEGEIFRLKMLQEQSAVQMEQLNGENAALRNKLRDVVCSPLSDNEKQMLLLDSQRHHSSAPASIATNALNEGDATTCSTPDWDKESCSNVSEVSVACLQDKINQMQETHYSTNEELQATLQELTDLQRQLSDLHQDNERLMEEKGLMFQSLCRQTERLNDARDEIDSLKQLLYKEKDTSGQYESVVEREQKLLELLKDSQEEREMILVKLEQRNTEITEVSNLNIQRDKESIQMEERIRTLESTLDAKHAEHKLLDQEMARAKDAASSRQIEIDRLKDLLENARTKIVELEQDRTVSDKSELEELLDNARKEKDLLESEVANLKEQVARGRNEGEKLREQVSILQEEFKVMRNNGKCMQSELEYKVEKLMMEKSQLAEQLQHLDEAAKELQVQAQCHLEDKHQLSSVLSETQRNMSEVERRNVDMEMELRHLEKLRAEENEEWDKFQKDLLTSVRVANDFKTEAQQELQKLILENKSHRDKIRQLEGQLEKLKAVESVPMRPTSFPTDELTRRASKVSLNRQNSRQSVKSLIESIENAGKPLSKSGSVSRSSSASSLNSLTSDGRTPSSPSDSPMKSPSEWEQKTPLKEQVPNTQGWSKSIINDGKSESMKGKNEECLRESILQQKGLDYTRRNSYTDQSDRKDPLNSLVKNGGSKRNALLKWCQNKTVGYRNIDITNFSSSWNDGLGFCAILHTYIPDRMPYDTLKAQEKKRNFSIAFKAAESVGIPTTLNINEMVQQERPDWQQIMSYVTAIYKHFET